MNDKILLTMESQQDMSYTMLDMRKQFEQLSQFMTAMADKMEIAMTRQHIDGTKYSNPGNLENLGQTKEANIVAGRASPEKKKQHTRSKHRIGDDEHNNCIIADKIDKDKIKPIEGLAYQEEKGEGFAIHGIGGEDLLEDMSESSDVCLNLEDAFEELQHANTLHQASGQHHIGNLASREAPTDLDDQYTRPLDPDGGKPD
ncbi:hypothetical protein MHU86_12079 [Fragilaria crotonensis]|nr:hypothetical protein MHU86_12079 [Fragilaria crotonensis]